MFWFRPPQEELAPVDPNPYVFPHPEKKYSAFTVEYFSPKHPEHKRYLLTNSRAVVKAHELKYSQGGYTVKVYINSKRFPSDRVCEETA